MRVQRFRLKRLYSRSLTPLCLQYPADIVARHCKLLLKTLGLASSCTNGSDLLLKWVIGLALGGLRVCISHTSPQMHGAVRDYRNDGAIPKVDKLESRGVPGIELLMWLYLLDTTCRETSARHNKA